jgi:hypothetical protein
MQPRIKLKLTGVKIKFDLVLRLEIKIKDDINIRVLVRSTIEALLKLTYQSRVKTAIIPSRL